MKYLNSTLLPQGHLNEDLEDPYVQSFFPDVQELYEENYSREQIRRELLNSSQQKGRTLTDSEVTSLINKGLRIFGEQYDKDREFVVSLHLQRYNEEIDKRLNVDVSEMNKYRAKEVMQYSYLQALEALYQKEKVLGLHTKQLQVKINNKNNIKVKVKKTNYKMSNLTLEEMIEMNNLIEKSKRTENEISSVILREERVEKVEVEDIEHEVINDNVSQIPQKEENELLKPVELRRTINDVNDKLFLAMKKQAEDEFKKAKRKN